MKTVLEVTALVAGVMESRVVQMKYFTWYRLLLPALTRPRSRVGGVAAWRGVPFAWC